MLSWRDHVLKEFPPEGPRLTLAEDPDGLLTEAEIAGALRERGYEVVGYEDPVAFRLLYDAHYRAPLVPTSGPSSPAEEAAPRHPHRELAEPASEAVGAARARALVVRTEGEARRLPWDLLRTGRVVGLGLAEIFPTLSYGVIAALEVSDLDALYRAQRTQRPGTLGPNATRDFVLRHVFGLATEMTGGAAELLHALLRRHYRELRVPPELDEHLVRRLRESPALRDWPLERIVPDRAAFLAFLQERWPIYLNEVEGAARGETVRERVPPLLTLPGPALLPFDDPNVRAYTERLIIDGALRPPGHRAGERPAE